MAAMSVLDAATLIVQALGMRFGSLQIDVVGGQVTLVRQGVVLKPEDLASLPLPEPDD